MVPFHLFGSGISDIPLGFFFSLPLRVGPSHHGAFNSCDVVKKVLDLMSEILNAGLLSVVCPDSL